jgi:hypothetical protein
MIPIIFNNRRRLAFKKRACRHFHEHDYIHKAIFLNHLDRLSMILQDMPNITFIDVPQYFIDLPEAQQFLSLKKTVNVINIQRNDEIIPHDIKQQNAIIALLTCHTINDLVGYFVQIKNALISDGVFIGSFIGNKTISIIKQAFSNAELESKQTYHNRFFPTIDMRDLGGLLQRTGFSLPVADSEIYRVHFKNLNTLIQDIRKTGNNNCLNTLPNTLNREIYKRALNNLAAIVPNHIFDLDIITITGRSPSEAQQKPLKAGSAQISMTKIL